MNMNVFVTLDRGYVDPLRVMLFSLCKSNPKHSFQVYVMHSSLELEDFERIRSAVQGRACTIIDLPVAASEFAEMPCSERWPREACYRIFAAKLLPQELNRALYLDPDLVVINDIASLYNMNLGNYFFAAASHMFVQMELFSRYRLRLAKDSRYINSGVMLFNLALLRREQEEASVYAYIQRNRRRLYLFDQDILNGVYHRRTKHINPLLFNLDEKYFRMYNANPYNFGRQISLPWVKRHSVIIHFNGKNKPWGDNYRGRFKEEFYEPFARAIGVRVEPAGKRPKSRFND